MQPNTKQMLQVVSWFNVDTGLPSKQAALNHNVLIISAQIHYYKYFVIVSLKCFVADQT